MPGLVRSVTNMYIYTHSLYSIGGHGAQSTHTTTSWEELKTQQRAAHTCTHPLPTSKKQITALIGYENLGFRECNQEKDSSFARCFRPSAKSEQLLTFLSLTHTLSLFSATHKGFQANLKGQSEVLQSDLSSECDIVRRADLIHCSASTFTLSPGNSGSADVASIQRGPPLSVGQIGMRD